MKNNLPPAFRGETDEPICPMGCIGPDLCYMEGIRDGLRRDVEAHRASLGPSAARLAALVNGEPFVLETATNRASAQDRVESLLAASCLKYHLESDSEA